jgi:hypothetical protein
MPLAQRPATRRQSGTRRPSASYYRPFNTKGPQSKRMEASGFELRAFTLKVGTGQMPAPILCLSSYTKCFTGRNLNGGERSKP